MLVVKNKILLMIIFGLALGNFFVWREVWGLNGGLAVIFFDVGQGDSCFIETGQGHQILIDGGPDGRVVLEKLGRTIPFWDRTIDLVILTHPDYDHLRGLIDVLDKYQVNNVLWTGGIKENQTFQSWLLALDDEQKTGVNIVIAQKGQVVKAGGAKFFILYPFESLLGQNIEKNSNDTSVVSQLVFGQTRFLFLGDISQKIEKQLSLISSFPYGLSSNVLKVAHHGSKYSSSLEFLEIVAPEIAIISVGQKNTYGHPASETLQSLKKSAIKVMRTDESGDVALEVTENGHIEIK